VSVAEAHEALHVAVIDRARHGWWSQQRQPLARLRIAQRRRLQPTPDAGVPLQIERRLAGMRIVPHGGRELVASEKILELQLVLRAAYEESGCLGIADAVAEDRVEPKGDLIDEVVRVALEAASGADLRVRRLQQPDARARVRPQRAGSATPGRAAAGPREDAADLEPTTQ
jgi:hypothetical protein